jgi:hypothetical protein
MHPGVIDPHKPNLGFRPEREKPFRRAQGAIRQDKRAGFDINGGSERIF